MKIVGYDPEHCAIIVKRKQLQNAGFTEGEDVYVITIENGLLGILRKSSFKEHLREAIRKGIDQPMYNDKSITTKLSKNEIEFLEKIARVKFYDRSPDKILTSISENEKDILKSLVDRGIIKLYRKGQGGDAIYTIDKRVYSQLQHTPLYESGIEEPAQQKSELAMQEVSKPFVIKDILSLIKRDGFAVVSGDEQAKQLSEQLKDGIKKGIYIGIRGFDSRYYVFSKKKYEELYDKINALFSKKKSLSLADICKSTELREDECKGVIYFMLENSELIEKSKGRYELI